MSAVAEPVSPPATPRQRGRPMLPVRGVVSLVDRDEDQVLALIEDGSIAWAFDVALDTKRGRSRELRILPAAVAAYMRGRACELGWADVLNLVLPHDGPKIVTKDVSRALNVSNTHVLELAKRKELRPCSTWRRGPGGSARFAAKSFVEFLKDRRVL